MRGAMKLGVIADDFTGAVDIAGFLVTGGLRTIMYSKPVAVTNLEQSDAIVMSLKIRNLSSTEAVAQALKALAFLQESGCNRFYYKYCSTFDSTPEGNIGPVTDALCKELGVSSTIICPALPINGRTVYFGYLFVQDQLLSESPMRYHPLTPMLDSKLARLLAQQSPSSSAHVYHSVTRQGVESVKRYIAALELEKVQNIIVDVVDDEDLDTIAEATEHMQLVTGGSGLAQGICNVETRKNGRKTESVVFIPHRTKSVVIAGSCSVMMQQQVAYYEKIAPSLSIDEQSCIENPNYAEQLAEWVIKNQQETYAPMVFATRSHEQLEENRKRFGERGLAGAIEQVFGSMATLLAKQGVRTFIIGGGETSGVVASSLAIEGYLIGKQIDPGVSWVRSLDEHYQLVFKSGNFGSESFLEKAQQEYIDATN